MLNKVEEIINSLKKNKCEDEQYLRLAVNNLFTNTISRRIFIQNHEKINNQFFL